MNKNLFFGLFLMFISVCANSQTENLKAINRDVWIPYMESYGTFNGVKYKSLQSEDFMSRQRTTKICQAQKSILKELTHGLPI